MPSHSQLRCITIFFVTFLSDSQASSIPTLNHWEKGNKICTLNMERGFLIRPARPLFQREEGSNLSYAYKEIRKVRTWMKRLTTRGTCGLPKPIFLILMGLIQTSKFTLPIQTKTFAPVYNICPPHERITNKQKKTFILLRALTRTNLVASLQHRFWR